METFVLIGFVLFALGIAPVWDIVCSIVAVDDGARAPLRAGRVMTVGSIDVDCWPRVRVD